MNIATLNMLEPRPIDPRRMIPVENVPLVQSTLNDRILLDLHLLQMDRVDFQSPLRNEVPYQPPVHREFNEDSSKKRPAKATVETKAKSPICANDLSTLLMPSSRDDKKTEPTPYAKVPIGQKTQDDGSCSSSASLHSRKAAKASGPYSDPLVFRSSQLEQWNTRFQELIQFKKENNHCSVPLHYPNNPSLAHWVKRQRHQYRTKKEGKHSTLTDERREKLERVGFIWDSHAAAWDERWNQLSQFRDEHGHSQVPKNYRANQPLAIWVKCQRRQFKLFSQGKPSNMTPARIEKLHHLGFVFDPRASK